MRRRKQKIREKEPAEEVEGEEEEVKGEEGGRNGGESGGRRGGGEGGEGGRSGGGSGGEAEEVKGGEGGSGGGVSGGEDEEVKGGEGGRNGGEGESAGVGGGSGGGEGKGIVFANGAIWKEQRAISLSILRSFGMGKSSLSSKINEEVCAYLDTLAALEGKPKDVATMTSISLANIICSIIVGRRFEYTDPFFISFMQNFRKAVMAAENISPVAIWPWLRFVPGNFLNSKTRNIIHKKMLSEFSDKFIELNEEQRKKGEAETFITSYLDEMEKLQKQGKETSIGKLCLRRVLVQLFIAGTDTSSTTIIWFMLFMLHHPHIQNK
ncbi:cytochrome p450 ii f2-like protein ii, partial [Plakobranchus ocellatus]